MQPVAMINAAFAEGGPVCSLKTIEWLTHIRIDHFVDVDFSGFTAIVDALGGVRICLPRNVADKDFKLFLSKGYHVVKGRQALAYVRNRHGLGDGSDLGRIKCQQEFLSAVAKQAPSAGTLSNPANLWPLLNAGTKSLTTDTGFGAPAMLELAKSLRGLTAGTIKFANDHDRAVHPCAFHRTGALAGPWASRHRNTCATLTCMPPTYRFHGATRSPAGRFRCGPRPGHRREPVRVPQLCKESV